MNETKMVNGLRVVANSLVAIGRRQLDFYRARPVTSTLFLTYRCNSRCKTCTMWQRPQLEEEKKEIGFAQWQSIIDQLVANGIRTTEIFGGNVLLRKELLVQILACLHERGIAIHLPTNQIGLDDSVADAIDRYVDTVYISTDGPGIRQNDIRGVDGAARHAEQSIARLRRLRERRGAECTSPRLVCNCTVSRLNLEVLEELVDYAREMGFDEVHFEYAGEFDQEMVDQSRINGLRPEPYYVRQDESILVDQAGARAVKAKLETIQRKNGRGGIVVSTINIDSLSEENLWRGTVPHKKCYVERNEVTIDPYGNLVACPFINNYMMGNLLEAPLEELWNNQSHRDFRKVQNRGGLPMCAHCILGVQRNPGVMTSMQRIYLARIKPVLAAWPRSERDAG